MKNNLSSQAPRGFSLLELLVALSVFLILTGATLKLVRQHVPLMTAQNNQAGLNLTMRNAVAQMQIDMVNAGTDFYPGINVPIAPFGITIQNNVPANGQSCYQGGIYTASCFDAINIISYDPSTPPANPADSGANCVSTTSSTLFATPPSGSSITTQALASDFHNGDQILLIKNDGSQMATVTLTSDGQVSGQKVKLAHNPTGANGVANNGNGDPLLLSQDTNQLGTQFCNTDWILKLGPAVTYKVNTTNPADPQLVRSVGGVDNVIADQIIGFKVGASIWYLNSDTPYFFNATADFPVADGGGCSSNCGYKSDWGAIRALHISLLARTASGSDGLTNYHNAFDGGNYMIEGMSVVINPRNLSMNDR